jgi:hypothetical protein
MPFHLFCHFYLREINQNNLKNSPALSSIINNWRTHYNFYSNPMMTKYCEEGASQGFTCKIVTVKFTVMVCPMLRIDYCVYGNSVATYSRVIILSTSSRYSISGSCDKTSPNVYSLGHVNWSHAMA